MNTEETKHYPWGPSAAKTWRGCPGSINFAAQEKAAGNIPKDEESEYAAEGTRAHAYVDDCLTGKIKRGDIPANFMEHLSGYLDLADDLAETVGNGDCVVMHEQQVPLFYQPDVYGTLDYGVVAEDGSEVTILDLKYGAGVYVTAEENDQLAIYALSLMDDLVSQGYVFTDDTEVSMMIYQPRHHQFTGDAEVWTVSYRDLLDMAVDIQEGYEKSLSASVDDLHPSDDACFFCDARVVCTRRITDLFDEEIPEGANMLVPAQQEEPHLPEVQLLTDAARVAIFKHHKAITKWMSDVVSDSFTKIEQGGPIEGLKTVDGKQGNRTWGDNEEDVSKLVVRKIPADDRFKPRSLKSPAQLEKILKDCDKPLKDQSTRFQNRWNELIVQRPGSPTLALEDDKRPARITGAEMFDDAVDEDDCF